MRNIPFKLYLFASLPSLCDILLSMFYSYSIVENEGSISIALRFFNLLFIVLINYLVFRPKKYAFQWTALAIVLVGIIFVSCSVLVGTNTKLNLIAVVLQVIAQIIQSTKSTIEQKLLHENDICPWWLTGVEGCYDFLFIFFIFNPIAYVLPEKTFNKLHENFCDSTLMVIHSKIIVILFFIYFPISCLYNGCVLGTIMTTDSISYTIVEMIGTSIGWIIDLIIYHGFNGVLFINSNKTFGAQWTKYSYLRLVGSLIFLFGELIYMSVIKFKCFDYPEAKVRRISIDCDETVSI